MHIRLDSKKFKSIPEGQKLLKACNMVVGVPEAVIEDEILRHDKGHHPLIIDEIDIISLKDNIAGYAVKIRHLETGKTDVGFCLAEDLFELIGSDEYRIVVRTCREDRFLFYKEIFHAVRIAALHRFPQHLLK